MPACAGAHYRTPAGFRVVFGLQSFRRALRRALRRSDVAAGGRVVRARARTHAVAGSRTALGAAVVLLAPVIALRRIACARAIPRCAAAFLDAFAELTARELCALGRRVAVERRPAHRVVVARARRGARQCITLMFLMICRSPVSI